MIRDEHGDLIAIDPALAAALMDNSPRLFIERPVLIRHPESETGWLVIIPNPMIADGSPLNFDNEFVLVVAFIIGVLGTARLTRLWVDDDWPPMHWLRRQYLRAVPQSWEGLVECPFCAAPWIALAEALTAWAWDLPWWWWLGNVWLGGSYLASMLVTRDLPPESRE